MKRPGYEDLKSVTDLRGRSWGRGEPCRGRPGVVVADIRRIGNFVQVDFAKAGALVAVPKVPQSLVLHMADLGACEPLTAPGKAVWS